jgi:hypothetical protein
MPVLQENYKKDVSQTSDDTVIEDLKIVPIPFSYWNFSSP